MAVLKSVRYAIALARRKHANTAIADGHHYGLVCIHPHAIGDDRMQTPTQNHGDQRLRRDVQS